MLKLSLPFTRDALLFPCLILIMAIIVYVLPNAVESTLIYDRELIAQGEYWRIITGHISHTNFNHLLLNLAGLILLWALHGDHYKHSTYVGTFIISALVCSFGIYFFDVQMQRYVGLSGVLHGVFVWGAICDIQKGWKSGYLLLIGVTLKVAHEQIFGASADVESLINARVAIDAHMWGAIGGAVLPILRYTKKHLFH